MVLVAGGTGRLGTQVVHRLTARRLKVRVLTRDPARARQFDRDLVEVVRGDVREQADAERATAGVSTVVSAIHGFAGVGGVSPRTVDGLGNAHLISAASANGAEHFVLVSVQGAAPDHPMELFRLKYAAEEELRRSGLAADPGWGGDGHDRHDLGPGAQSPLPSGRAPVTREDGASRL